MIRKTNGGDVNRPLPLAERMRPGSLENIRGQSEIVSLLRSFVTQGELPSMIFWGPPGSGKTTLCRVLANELMWDSASLNATSSSVKDIRKLAERASLTWEQWEKRTLVFIDEIHRLNKGQQDVLLPFLEDGTFVLLGSTTQNPYFSINNALRSRVQLITLNPIESEVIQNALEDAAEMLEMKKAGIKEKIPDNKKGEVKISSFTRIFEWISTRSGGDLRLAYATLEGASILASSEKCDLRIEHAQKCLNRQVASGHSNDNHYDLASAYQKSLRGSDVNAAVYYLARFLLTGEDPRFIARRLWITASEDVGNQDPQALLIAQSAYFAVEKMGMPEVRIPLTQATIYVAKSPKSNQAITAIQEAYKIIESTELPPVPDHLKNRHQPGLSGKNKYVYTHNHPEKTQSFLPDTVQSHDICPIDPKPNQDDKRKIQSYLLKENQDWSGLDIKPVADSLDVGVGVLREVLNELVRCGELQFRRQFRAGKSLE